jgi:hypothetical protein
MATSPYRIAARPPARPAGDPPERLGLRGVAVFLWGVTLLRVAVAARQGEPPSQELALAMVVLLGAPVVVYRELTSRRRGTTS